MKKSNQPKLAHTLIVMQAFFSVLMAFNYSGLTKLNWGNWVKIDNPFYFGISMFAISILAFINLNISQEREREEWINQGKLEEARRTVGIYKKEKYIFLNVIQVVTSYIQLNKPKKALNYLNYYSNDCYNNLNLLDVSDKTELLTALLEGKYKAYEKYGVEIKFEIEANLTYKLNHIKQNDLIYMIRILLKQSVEAQLSIKEVENRIVTLYFRENDDGIIFEILHNAPLKLQLIDSKFEKIIQYYNGKVEIANPEDTIIVKKLFIPFKKEQKVS